MDVRDRQRHGLRRGERKLPAFYARQVLAHAVEAIDRDPRAHERAPGRDLVLEGDAGDRRDEQRRGPARQQHHQPSVAAGLAREIQRAHTGRDALGVR